MILTEPGITWRRSFEATGPRGEAIKRAIKAGTDVPGAHLMQTERLDVRA